MQIYNVVKFKVKQGQEAAFLGKLASRIYTRHAIFRGQFDDAFGVERCKR